MVLRDDQRGDTMTCEGVVQDKTEENGRTRLTVTLRAVIQQGTEAVAGSAIVWL